MIAAPARAEVGGKLRHLRGWCPSLPDLRDEQFSAPVAELLPPKGGPSQWRSQVEDQGPEGSCTANAGTSAFELVRRKGGLPEVQFSRQGLYWTTRVLLEGKDPGDDSGASIRDMLRALSKHGVGTEEGYPYTQANFARNPGEAYFREASLHRLLRYNACPTVGSIKTMLAGGWPVVFGFSVPSAMMAEEFDGFLKFPDVAGGYVGGHAVYTDHYDDTVLVPGELRPGAFLVVNSWGWDWGLRDNPGCMWMPYRYFEAGISRDAYAVRSVVLI